MTRNVSSNPPNERGAQPGPDSAREGTAYGTVPLKPTLYERVLSLLLSLVIFGCVVVGFLGAIWLTNQVWGSPAPLVPTEILLEDPGGDLEGDPDTPEEAFTPTTIQEWIETEVVEQVVENVTQVLAQTPVLAEPEALVDPLAAYQGPVGRRPFGSGPGVRGLPRQERWIITYPPEQSLQEYAQLLDSFGIELGVFAGKQFYIISRLSSPTPQAKQADPRQERRLYFTWRTGERQKADYQLAQKAGLQEIVAVVQLIPPELEKQLAELERKYKGKRPDQILSTRFRVRRAGPGKWEFYVASQLAAGD
jgi:hypothetical protein